jgi:hypothetical protein
LLLHCTCSCDLNILSPFMQPWSIDTSEWKDALACMHWSFAW